MICDEDSVPTSKEQPENSPSNFAFDEIQAFIGGFFVHAECDSDMGCLTESRVLCCVMPLAEMVDTVTVKIMRRHR